MSIPADDFLLTYLLKNNLIITDKNYSSLLWSILEYNAMLQYQIVSVIYNNKKVLAIQLTYLIISIDVEDTRYALFENGTLIDTNDCEFLSIEVSDNDLNNFIDSLIDIKEKFKNIELFYLKDETYNTIKELK